MKTYRATPNITIVFPCGHCNGEITMKTHGDTLTLTIDDEDNVFLPVNCPLCNSKHELIITGVTIDE